MSLKPTLLATALLAASLTVSLSAHASGTLQLNPAASTVNAGEAIVIDVSGAGFTDKVVGGGLSLSFNPAVLSLQSVSIDTVTWEFVSSGGLIDNASGTLSDVYFNSFKPVLPTGDFNVARLTFTAKADGTSPITLSASGGFPFANDQVELIDVNYLNASVQVGAVPEPASVAMMLSGLAGLVGWQRRRRAAV